MGEMKLEVDCYSGRTADERPVRFRLEDCQYMVEEVPDQWYGPRMLFTKYARTTAISISCVGKRRRLRVLGIWCHSGNCHARTELTKRSHARDLEGQVGGIVGGGL